MLAFILYSPPILTIQGDHKELNNFALCVNRTLSLGIYPTSFSLGADKQVKFWKEDSDRESKRYALDPAKAGYLKESIEFHRMRYVKSIKECLDIDGLKNEVEKVLREDFNYALSTLEETNQPGASHAPPAK